jgi:ribose transport system permease protein
LEVYAHIGGHPLGMAFNRERELVVCVGGMGLYKITRDREVVKLSDETNRTPWSIIDDSRMRIADDLDIAPDGRVFFSEATIRYDTEDWTLDSLEGRGNGRFIVYDPRTGKTRTIIPNMKFANGICMAYDGESFLFAESYGYCIKRYWFAGPKTGQIEDVIPNLPAVPDNINRASDGNYWAGLVGTRTPTFDLALRMPGFRRRMVNRVARDEWMVPNFNRACLIKIDVHGNILECYWDRAGEKHPSLTSMREHKGYLYLGSLFHSRIGKWKIPGADPNWTGIESYWGDRP